MNKLNLLVLIMFCVAFTACAQEEVKLKASALRNTIFLGESVKIRLSLEGIQSDIFKNKKQVDKHSLDGFFEGYQDNNDFRTFVYVSPNLLGKNIVGPYQINLLDKEFTSNEVIIQVVKPDVEHIHIEMPNEGVVGEKIQIKITGNSNRAFSAQFKENEIFKVNIQSSSSQVSSGKYSMEAKYTVTLKKKGVFELNRSLFKDLPDHIKLDPVKFEIK